MNLLGRIRTARAERGEDPSRPRAPEHAPPCPRCGEQNDRIIDPSMRWYVCTRCGQKTDLRSDV